MDDEFESFWKVYPRRCNKGDARKAWKQTEKIRPPLAELLKAVYAARASKKWHEEDGQYIPYPGSWLRGERWEDQHEVDLSELDSPTGRVCAYCGKDSVGATNGKWYCRDHVDKALANERPVVVQIGTRPAEPVIDKKLQSAGRD